MQNKLQELTDRLYEEGLSKGRQEADQLVANAKAEAQEILDKAREEAEAVRADAEKRAANIRSMVQSDIKMASTQAIAALKQQVENMVLTKAVAEPVGASLSDKGFVKDLITMVVRAFNASNADGIDLEVILPDAAQKELEKAFANEVRKILDKGIEVKNVKGLANGFQIGPKDGGYRLSFTADDFTGLVGEYLRPATKKILFGE
jgi:Archaeal/vacuolar-type H+-ATPase subunit E